MDRPVIHRHSLKNRITLATLVLFVLGIWSLTFYASQMLRKDMERVLGEQQLSIVSMVAGQANRELEGRFETLTEVARTSVKAMAQGPAAMQAHLEQRKELEIQFNGGTFATGIDGITLAAVPNLQRVGVSYMDREYLVGALREGKDTISPPILGRTSRMPVIAVAVPIRDAQGAVVGALAGVMKLGQSDFMERLDESGYGKTGSFLLVVPGQRLVATATDKNRIMEVLPPPGVNRVVDRFIEGYEGSQVGLNPLGIEVLTSAKKIPLTGDWYVAIAMPTAEAFAPIRDMQQRMLMAAIVMTLVAGVLIWWILKRQLSPLSLTARAMAGMAEARQPLHPLPIVRDDEIGKLVGGFNRLLEMLGQRESMLKQILDNASVAIFLVGMDGRITQANKCMAEMFGVPLENLLGNEYVSLVHPSQREIGRQRMLALLSDAIPSVDLDRLYRRADNTEFWGHLTGRAFYDAEGVKQGLVAAIADINKRKLAEEKLQLAASVFTFAREGITITAADGSIIDVNESFTRITGYSREEVLGQNPRVLKSDHHEPDFYAALWRDIVDKGFWTGEIWNRRKSGDLYPEILTISAVRDEQGVAQHYVALFSDITPMKEHQKQLEHMAHYDLLTALPNRALLADRLHQGMVQGQRHGTRLAVAYLDLDGFKAINDTYGHKTGDLLLIAVANRMKQVLREGDTLARLGGDEFVAVLLDQGDISSSVPMLNRLLAAAAHPVRIGELDLQVSACLGVTFYPQAGAIDADQLLRQADQAMYQAKLSGKNRYHFFDDEQDRSVRGHHESLEHIRSALSAREFVLYYQPKVNMRTGMIIGAEALIRWQHPERGLLPPSVFLPLIENHALAIDVGDWVVDTALCQMESWQAAGLNIPVSVNIGARQLQQRDFALRLREILLAHPAVKHGDLELEVLETSALEDIERISQVIKNCQALGVKFALDDFGTGYSSLTYLKHLSVNQLKIDQSFVRDMLDDPDDLAILEGVLGLATAFRRQVIAEGVETVAHGTMLLQLGCELAQGYGIARPMPAADLPAWANGWHPDPAWLNRAPVSREELPVLFACTEHRAWVAAIEAHLGGKRDAPPLNPHHCNFGEWIDTQGWVGHGKSPIFNVVERLHVIAHDLAIQLCELHASGYTNEALSRLGELHAARDSVLEHLLKLVKDNKA